MIQTKPFFARAVVRGSGITIRLGGRTLAERIAHA